MDDEEYEERRIRLYHRIFEEYNSLYITYNKYYTASDSLKRRGTVLTYAATISSGILLFLIGSIVTTDSTGGATNLALGISAIVAAISFINAVDSPQRLSNVYYNSGQILQELYLQFDYMVTIRLPDKSENLSELEEDCEQLISQKNTINEATPQLGNKWYKRVKEERTTSWEPKPLSEVTGEDGEFEEEEKGNNEKNTGYILTARTWILQLYSKPFHWLGY